MNPRPDRPAAAALQRGISLVESLIVMSIATVTLGAVVPGFESVRERRQLEGAAAQFETDVHFTRSLAAAHNRPLRLQFGSDAAGSCYVVHSGAAGDCRCSGDGQAQCSGAAQVLRLVHHDAAAPVQWQANVGAILFDPHQGTSSPTGTLRLSGRSGTTVHAVVSLMGRVRQCAPAPGVPGWTRC